LNIIYSNKQEVKEKAGWYRTSQLFINLTGSRNFFNVLYEIR